MVRCIRRTGGGDGEYVRRTLFTRLTLGGALQGSSSLTLRRHIDRCSSPRRSTAGWGKLEGDYTNKKDARREDGKLGDGKLPYLGEHKVRYSLRLGARSLQQ